MARVLVIDDSSDMLAMLRMFFERRTEHDVVLAKNGKEGLAKAFESPPSLALVDVMMPGMDGYEVVRQLRDHPATSKIGIIVLTARGQPVDQTAALQAGADVHMPKPVNIEVLSSTVESLLRKVEEAGISKLVLPVMGLRGGTGVTTLAVNLAVLLQQIGPTVLWDLSPVSGHASLFLGIQPRQHWGFYLRDTTTPIDSLLKQHRTGLQVLNAPPIPEMFGWFDEAGIETVLSDLKEVARFVVIDMPRTLDDTIGPILRAAHKLLLVAGDDPPAIQTTLASLQALQKWHLEIIIAHNASRPGKSLNVGALERAMHINIHSDIPYDPNQRLVLGKGIPLALAKLDSPLITNLQTTAQLLLEQ